MKETIHLLHVNDLHSHFEHWEKIVRYMDEQKELYESAGDIVYKLDIGDHVDRFHPFTEGTMGKGNIELLNAAGMDGATIGNNEGITLPHEALNHLYDEARFPVTVANLYDELGRRPNWALPYFIRTTPQGRKVAFFGVTAPFTELYRLLGWKLTDPYEEIGAVLKELEGQADLIVLLSHLGLPSDEWIAANYPGIHVILGGHTHHILHHGKVIGNTLICGAGKYGMFVGHVEITIDNGEITAVSSLKGMTDEGYTNKEIETANLLYNQGKAELSDVLLNITHPLTTDWFKTSDMPKLLCEGLREWCKTDCAFINAGLLLDGLDKGPITRFDLHRICPHPINPCILTVSGWELLSILAQTENPKWPHFQVKGLGFRGSVMGMFVYDGVEKKDGDWRIHGERILKRAEYTLAIPDMFTFGYLFPEIKDVKRKRYLMPEFLRDLLGWKLAQSAR
ncbi:bifunctional metallophosphatase/5'-nucleotidase [Pradoshia eiseniae]|uniref:Bifunctional metallophosphatase/5'-nucleotidase n=1 Tax=Pradoshia eiseniae TaxID=2064768 RepID=A0A2S7MZM7_9BACI|nr:bifunctional UDP-sugar hydrolase/5'-nucleotidase [Pradoshia eiseniae]PQD95197.1 bifunctional metallophosphatase/5'-nucleotidase [Pradoshia eiseniae]